MSATCGMVFLFSVLCCVCLFKIAATRSDGSKSVKSRRLVVRRNGKRWCGVSSLFSALLLEEGLFWVLCIILSKDRFGWCHVLATTVL